jgi:hypothetical protein
MSEETASDKNVEIWKVKKLIKSLQLARGNGTSMISLIIPPGDQVRSRISRSHSTNTSGIFKPSLRPQSWDGLDGLKVIVLALEYNNPNNCQGKAF